MPLALTGTLPLSNVQGAYETTPGTGIAAKRKVYITEGELHEYVNRTFPQERRGSFIRNFRSYPTQTYSEITGVQVAPTYEDLPWWAGLALDGRGATPAPTAVTAWRYDFSAFQTAETLKTATMEIGDSTQAWQVPFVLVNRFELTFGAKEPTSLAMDLLGSVPVASSFTSNLAERDTEDINGALAVAYIDTTTIGSTAVTNVLSAKFTVDNHWNQFYALTGSLAPTDAYRGETRTMDVEMSLAFHNATEYNVWKSTSANQTPRKIRIQVQGSAIAGASGSQKKSLTLDAYTVWDTAEFGTQDGLRVVNFKGQTEYDSTALLDWKLSVINAISAATAASTF